MKFNWITLIFIISASGSNASCLMDRSPRLKSFVGRVVELPLNSESFTKNMAQTRNEIKLLEYNKIINDTTLDFGRSLSEHENSLTLSSDFSIWKQKTAIKPIEAEINLKSEDERGFKNDAYFELTSAIFSILTSDEYIRVFELRERTYKDLLKYYQDRIDMGSDEFQKKLKVEQDLIILANKMISAQIKSATLLFQNNLTRSDLATFHFFSPEFSEKKYSCNEKIPSIHKLDLQIALLNAQLKDALMSYAPDLVGSITKTWDDKGYQDLSAAIKLNLTIYKGNKRSKQIQNIRSQILNLELERNFLEKEFKSSLDERIEIDKILLKSKEATIQKIKDKEESLSKLKLKSELGGAVFEEKTQLLLEISMLNEALIAITADFVSSWLKLFHSRGMFNNVSE